MIRRTTLWANQPSAESLDQYCTRYSQMHDSGDRVTSVLEHAIERLRLGSITRIPVQECPAIVRHRSLELIEPRQQDPERHIVRDQLASIVVTPYLAREIVIARHQLAKEISSRNMHESERCSDSCRLRALAGSLWPDQNDVTPPCHTPPSG